MAAASPAPALHHAVIFLDWTPAVTHLGFYVAQARGYFAAHGVSVTLLPADVAGYGAESGADFTPVRRLLAQPPEAAAAPCAAAPMLFALAPSESVVSVHTTLAADDARRAAGGARPRNAVAVAALLAKDASCIAALAGGRVARPRDLDGATYASYVGRFEDAIIRAVARADGGAGDVRVVAPPKLSCFDALLSGAADATWIFSPVEGVAAARAGTELKSWALGDYGVPYGYSPVLVARTEALAGAAGAATARALLAAAARGWAEAAADPAAAAADLVAAARHAAVADAAAVAAGAAALAPYVLAAPGARWGEMDGARWAAFTAWMAASGVLREGEVVGEPGAMFTNDYLAPA